MPQRSWKEHRIASHSYIYIQNEKQADTLKEDLGQASRIALDCEAAGFHRYSDRLCLVQITTDNATYVLDALGFNVSPLLRPSLEHPDVQVNMHGSDFDLVLLGRDLGIRLSALFDTQIAAALLGRESLGLASLLKDYQGIGLSKKYQRADWAMRPLTEGMLEYAAADTQYLNTLSDQMHSELRARGRESWLVEECRALEESSSAVQHSEKIDPVSRVKGARELTPRQLTALRKALQWRDQLARENDKALFRIIGDGPLLEAVVVNPQRTRELFDIKGFPKGLARNKGSDLVRIFESVAQVPESELQSYPSRPRARSRRSSPETEALLEALKLVRNALSEKLGIAKGTLLSNAVLSRVARTNPQDLSSLAEVEGMRRWKIEVVGDSLLEVIHRG